MTQGSAVSMPWLDGVPAVIQAWHTGNEAGNALADIIYGVVNPGGRLPITLPARDEDVPAYLNFGSENGKVHYREDLFVGYKALPSAGCKATVPIRVSDEVYRRHQVANYVSVTACPTRHSSSTTSKGWGCEINKKRYQSCGIRFSQQFWYGAWY